MAKKPQKNVLDYDPLAWLDNEDSDEQLASNVQTTQENSTDDSPGYGFFDDDTNMTPNQTPDEETPVTVKLTHEEEEQEQAQGYGFFNEADTSANSSEDDAGFGFFDDAPGQLQTQAAEVDPTSNVINLGAELTIRSVASCKSLIDESVNNGFDVKLAAGELQKIDSAGLQLIYSLKQSLQKTGQSIQWEQPNAIINQAARIIGLHDLLEMEDEEAGYGFFEDESTAAETQQSNDAGFGFF